MGRCVMFLLVSMGFLSILNLYCSDPRSKEEDPHGMILAKRDEIREEVRHAYLRETFLEKRQQLSEGMRRCWLEKSVHLMSHLNSYQSLMNQEPVTVSEFSDFWYEAIRMNLPETSFAIMISLAEKYKIQLDQKTIKDWDELTIIACSINIYIILRCVIKYFQ